MWILAASVAPYFVVRGWVTGAVLLLGLYAVAMLAFDPGVRREYRVNLDLRWLALALAAPVLGVGIVQLLRGEFIPRYFDPPSRLLLAAALAGLLAQRRVDALRALAIALPVAVLLCGAMLAVPNAATYFWNQRVATYFMDPLTLAQHVTIAGFVCLFLLDLGGRDPIWARLLKIAAFGVAVSISIATQSRTGWLMMPVLAMLWLIGWRRAAGVRSIVTAAVAVAAICLVTYAFSDVIRMRVDAAVSDVTLYFNGGDRDTSVGIRLSIFRALGAMIIDKPLLGWGFQGVPMPSAIPSLAGLTTPLFNHFYVHGGGHNELLQSMLRMGVFGLASRFLLYFVPLFLFARAARSSDAHRRTAGYVGLTVVIGYLTAGLTSEVFNLVYASAFYGLLLACAAAGALRRDDA